MKKFVVVVAVVAALAFMVQGVAYAEEELQKPLARKQYNTVQMVNIPAWNKQVAVVTSADKGGPLGGGFFGATRVKQDTYALNSKNELEKLSSYGSTVEGPGKVVLQNTAPVATGGLLYVWGQQTRAVNQTTQNVSAGNATGNVQAQGQGQLQGQGQGQLQAQGQAQGQLQGQQQQQGLSDGNFSPVTNVQP